MLPDTVQFIIAMIASALADRLTKKMDYMREEQPIPYGPLKHRNAITPPHGDKSSEFHPTLTEF